jgi:hypothetical protein
MMSEPSVNIVIMLAGVELTSSSCWDFAAYLMQSLFGSLIPTMVPVCTDNLKVKDSVLSGKKLMLRKLNSYVS